MISSLSGSISSLAGGVCVLEAGPIGYEVLVSSRTESSLEGKTQTKLLTHLVVKEDSHSLYGFLLESERRLFRLLIGQVSGVGAATALSILGAVSVPEFQNAVVQKDLATLSKIKRLGRKTAERICLEIGDKLQLSAVWSEGAESGAGAEEAEAITVLVSLGYKTADARKALDTLPKGLAVEEKIKLALKALR